VRETPDELRARPGRRQDIVDVVLAVTEHTLHRLALRVAARRAARDPELWKWAEEARQRKGGLGPAEIRQRMTDELRKELRRAHPAVHPLILGTIEMIPPPAAPTEEWTQWVRLLEANAALVTARPAVVSPRLARREQP
jgi:hypothetical protein